MLPSYTQPRSIAGMITRKSICCVHSMLVGKYFNLNIKQQQILPLLFTTDTMHTPLSEREKTSRSHGRSLMKPSREDFHTTLSDNVEVFSSVEYFASNTFKKERNRVLTDCVVLLPVCAYHAVKEDEQGRSGRAAETDFYLCQVNEVNGRDTVFVQYVCQSVFLSVCALQSGQSDQFKTNKATDFKFDKHVPRDSLDMTLKNYYSVKIHLAEICTLTTAY